jgi:hypothetical protein
VAKPIGCCGSTPGFDRSRSSVVVRRRRLADRLGQWSSVWQRTNSRRRVRAAAWGAAISGRLQTERCSTITEQDCCLPAIRNGRSCFGNAATRAVPQGDVPSTRRHELLRMLEAGGNALAALDTSRSSSRERSLAGACLRAVGSVCGRAEIRRHHESLRHVAVGWIEQPDRKEAMATVHRLAV